jgi:hypothetical protein
MQITRIITILLRVCRAKMLGFLLLTVLTLVPFSSVIAASATGTATATVLNDVFSSNCSPLSFGSIAASSSAGAVVLTPEGKRLPVGLVVLGSAPHQPSRCDITGKPNTNYRVKVPTSLEFTVTPHSEPNTSKGKLPSALAGKNGTPDDRLKVTTIRVYSENKRAVNFTGKTNASGRDKLLLGATLHVTRNTAPGVYQGVIPLNILY